MLEVERKFRADDAGELRQSVVRLGGTWSDPKTQIDQYFAHPARDFATTDEALRIRWSDNRCAITYKGPKLDQHTKIRQEIELDFDPSITEPDQAAELLLALGFRSVAEVIKQRETATLDRAGKVVTLDLDQVQHLGSFIELEIVCEQRDLLEAQAAMAVLAGELALHEDIRDSYLELLLAK